jgi:hypothetical protein
LHRRPNEHKKKYPTKGGNWHYFLHHIGYKYDYIVFTDSGTILQPDFIEKNIRLFYAGVENLAIVQGYHCAYAKFSLWEKIMYKWDETFHRHTVGSLNNIYSAAFCNGFAFIVKTKCLMEIPINKVNVYTCDQAISFFFWKKYKSLYSPLSVAMKIRSLTFFSNIMQLAKWCSTDWRSIVSPKNHTLPILSTAWGFWWFLSTWGRWISIFFINIVFPVMLVFGQINPYLIITNVWVLLPSLLFLLSFGILTIWGMFYDVKSLLSSILFLLFYLTVGNYLKLILVFVAFSKILHIKINYHVTEKNNFVEKSWKTTFKLIWKYNLCIMLFIIFLMTSYFVWTYKTSHFDLITFILFCGVISQLVNAMIMPFVLNTFSYLKLPKSRGGVYNYKKWIIDDFKYLKDK